MHANDIITFTTRNARERDHAPTSRRQKKRRIGHWRPAGSIDRSSRTLMPKGADLLIIGAITATAPRLVEKMDEDPRAREEDP